MIDINKTFAPQRGFTLLEIMVVVVILGILAALVAPNVINRIDDARLEAARSDLRTIQSQLEMFRLHAYRYPSTEEGLEALVNEPSDADLRDRWKGPYLSSLPNDPWGRPYLYLSPGSNGEFDVYTYGADGQPGGEGPASDIGNWNLN